MPHEVFIVEAVRTPIARGLIVKSGFVLIDSGYKNGALHELQPVGKILLFFFVI